MNYSWHDIIGNIGVALIIITYFLLQMGRMNSASYKYSFLNALGASFVIVSLMFEFNMSAFIVEAFWVGISLFGIIRLWRLRH